MTDMPKEIWIDPQTECEKYTSFSAYRNKTDDHKEQYVHEAEIAKRDSVTESLTKALEVAREGLRKADKSLDKFDIKASDMRIGKPCLIVGKTRSQIKQALAQINEILGGE